MRLLIPNSRYTGDVMAIVICDRATNLELPKRNATRTVLLPELHGNGVLIVGAICKWKIITIRNRLLRYTHKIMQHSFDLSIN